MGMFTSYLDDSGHEDSPSTKGIVAAGFVASVDQWLRFESEWHKALKQFKLPACFHTTDFIAGQGEFSAWKNKKAEKQTILRHLVGIIRLRVRYSVSLIVMLDDYCRVNQTYMLQEHHGYPFSLCARSCAKVLNEWKAKYAPRATLDLVFEDGVKHKGDVVEVFSRDQLPIPSFKAKCSIAGLQAADLLAWHAHYMVNKIEKGAYADRTDYWKSFSELLKIPGSAEHGMYWEKDLIELCGVSKVRRRGELPDRAKLIFHSAPKRLRPSKQLKRPPK